jgi:hypothetical protein
MAVDRVTAPLGPTVATGDVAAARVSVRRISWGAVLAGVIILLAVQLLLSMLGVGIGASTIDPLQEGSPEGRTLGIGAGIWWVVTALLATFAGSWVAGRLAGVPVRTDGMLHGLVTWGLATLLLIYFLTTTVSSLVGGAFGVVGSAMQTAGQTAGTAAQTAAQTPQGQGALGQIQSQIQQTFDRYSQQMSQTGQQVQRAAQDEQTRAVLQKAITAGPDALTPADREAALSALQQHAGMTRPEAERQLAQWEQSYREAAQTAREVGEKTADTVAQASLWSFVALALGAIVAAVGGMVGAPRSLPYARV